MTTITFTTKLEGVLTNATSVTLSNSDATIGIKRNDTGAVVVAAGTVLTNSSTGTYSYVFTAPAESVFYTAYIKITASGSTLYHTIVFYVGLSSSTIVVPSAVISQYLISTLGLFTAISEASTWPLYQAFLPDSGAIEDDAAAIFDIAPYIQGKDMGGSLNQRYGIQFLIRSRSYNDGFTKASILLSSLQNKSQVYEIVGGTTFIIENISSASGVVSVGTERSSKQRFIFSLDLLVTIKEL